MKIKLKTQKLLKEEESDPTDRKGFPLPLDCKGNRMEVGEEGSEDEIINGLPKYRWRILQDLGIHSGHPNRQKAIEKQRRIEREACLKKYDVGGEDYRKEMSMAPLNQSDFQALQERNKRKRKGLREVKIKIGKKKLLREGLDRGWGDIGIVGGYFADEVYKCVHPHESPKNDMPGRAPNLVGRAVCQGEIATSHKWQTGGGIDMRGGPSKGGWRTSAVYDPSTSLPTKDIIEIVTQVQALCTGMQHKMLYATNTPNLEQWQARACKLIEKWSLHGNIKSMGPSEIGRAMDPRKIFVDEYCMFMQRLGKPCDPDHDPLEAADRLRQNANPDNIQEAKRREGLREVIVRKIKRVLQEGIQDPNDPDSPLMRNDDDYVSDFTGIPWSEESVASEIGRAKELDSDDHQYPQDELSTAIKDVIDLVAEYEEEYSEDANGAMMELHAELDKKFGTKFLRFNVHPNQIKRSDDREAKRQNIKSMERSQLGFGETIKRWGKIIKG